MKSMTWSDNELLYLPVVNRCIVYRFCAVYTEYIHEYLPKEVILSDGRQKAESWGMINIK